MAALLWIYSASCFCECISLCSGVVFNIAGIFGENLASEISLSSHQPLPPGASTGGGCVVADLGLFVLL